MALLRAKIAEKRPGIACWMHFNDAFVSEMLAQAGFDVAVVDMQHGNIDSRQALEMLRGMRSVNRDVSPFVRVPSLDPAVIGRMLDFGFEGLICPMVNTAEQCKAFIAASMYKHHYEAGERSWGPTRATVAGGLGLEAYHKHMGPEAATRPFLLAMIETEEALGNLEQILDVSPVLDGVFIGPMDLSLSLGEPCQGHAGKRTAAAIEQVVTECRKRRKAVGVYCGTADAACSFVAKGFDFVVSAHDKICMQGAAKAALAKCRKAEAAAAAGEAAGAGAEIRIRTTHIGSLPRPADLLTFIRGEAPPPADFGARLDKETEAVMKRQTDVGLDMINDGELARRDYVTAARQRLSGFDATKAATGAADLEEMTEYSDKFEGRKGLLTLTKKTEVLNSACSGPVAYLDAGFEDLQKEIQRTVAAAKSAGVPLDRVFFSSPSPGTIANFFPDAFYGSHAKYVDALGKAMKREYDAIHAAGLLLQVDCPDLAMGRHTQFKDGSLEDFVAAARVNVEVMNAAVADIPADRMRMHVCWGNYPGPHHHDVPLRDVVSVVLSGKPMYLSIEACNPGHAHEWEVFADVKLPEGKVLMPGVIDTTTNHIEHPELVAQRLMNYVKLVGPQRVVACPDCGFSTAAGAVNVPTDLVYAKLQSMVKGAALASQMAKKLTVAY